MSHPAIFLERDGVILSGSPISKAPSRLFRDACDYHKLFPDRATLEAATETAWTVGCRDFPRLVQASTDHYAHEAGRESYAPQFVQWAGSSEFGARRAKLHAYVLHVLMGPVVFLPGSLQALGRLAQQEQYVFLVANQENGLSVGYNCTQLQQIHRMVAKWITCMGGRITASQIWPNPPIALETPSTPYREMMASLASIGPIDWSRSWLIVDYPPAAEAVTGFDGMRALLVRTGRGESITEDVPEWPVVADLPEAVAHIERNSK